VRLRTPSLHQQRPPATVPQCRRTCPVRLHLPCLVWTDSDGWWWVGGWWWIVSEWVERVRLWVSRPDSESPPRFVCSGSTVPPTEPHLNHHQAQHADNDMPASYQRLRSAELSTHVSRRTCVAVSVLSRRKGACAHAQLAMKARRNATQGSTPHVHSSPCPRVRASG
jgi:hypothetical protein